MGLLLTRYRLRHSSLTSSIGEERHEQCDQQYWQRCHGEERAHHSDRHMNCNRQEEPEANCARTAAANHGAEHHHREERMEPKHQRALRNEQSSSQKGLTGKEDGDRVHPVGDLSIKSDKDAPVSNASKDDDRRERGNQ